MLFILVKRFPYALVYEKLHVWCLTLKSGGLLPPHLVAVSGRRARRVVFPYLFLFTKRLVNDNSSDEGNATLVVDSATDMTTSAVLKANEQPAILYTVWFGYHSIEVGRGLWRSQKGAMAPKSGKR